MARRQRSLTAALDEIISISGPQESAPTIDVTALDDTARAYLRGIEDGGELTIEGHWDPADTLGQVAARAAFTGGTTENWKITFTDSPVSTMTFSALVTSFGTAMQVDDTVKVTIGLKLTGAITVA